MSGDVVMAIDLGTGGPKVALITIDGQCLGWRARPVTTRLVGAGGAEQDPEEMWTAVCDAARQVMDECGRPQLCGVAVTSQYMSTVPVAADGTPTGPCILWMDCRGATHARTLLSDESFLLFVERHGLFPLPSGHDGVSHVSVLRDLHPDSYAAAAAFVEPMDYLTARLTGRVTATQSTMFGQLVCDNRTWGLTEYDRDLVAATRLDPAKLPALVPMGDVIGEITTVAAAELGVAAGVPVLAGTIDSITSAVGTGAVDAERCGVVVGTTSVMVTHIGEQRNDVMSSLLTVPSPLPGQWYVMAENGLGGRAFDWAYHLLGFTDAESALASAASTEAQGVRFAPWLTGSLAPAPDEQVRGAWVGLGLGHGRAEMIRAVLEGIAANLGWLYPALEQFAEASYDHLTFGGGGAQSGLLAQMLADACGRDVRRVAAPRATNARGAALLAFHQLGRLTLDDLPERVPVESWHHPTEAGMVKMAANVTALRALHGQIAGRL
jgi:xylulokinase